MVEKSDGRRAKTTDITILTNPSNTKDDLFQLHADE